jgi:hypothetical protein
MAIPIVGAVLAANSALRGVVNNAIENPFPDEPIWNFVRNTPVTPWWLTPVVAGGKELVNLVGGKRKRGDEETTTPMPAKEQAIPLATTTAEQPTDVFHRLMLNQKASRALVQAAQT